MATATHISTDQDWQDGIAIYWFDLEGTDYGTEVEFNGEMFGIAESDEPSKVLDADGAPMTDSDHVTIAVRNTVEVTDKMRFDG